MIYKMRIAKRLPVVLSLLCFVIFSNCQTTTTGANGDGTGIRVLMVGGGASHDFDRWYKQADAETLRKDALATVRYTSDTDSIDDYLRDVDVLYLVNNQPIGDPAVRKAIFDFVERGKGLVLGHAALWYNWNDWPEYNNQLVSGGSRGHDRYGDFKVTVTQPDHVIMKGVPSSFTLKDELYHFKPDPAGPGITVLATASTADSDVSYPSVFVIKHNNGRIAGIALGHDGESHELPAYRDLLRNAVTWAANTK
jgi:type 1 glutamine amidotransferase